MTAYRRLGFQPYVTEHPVWENRLWGEQPRKKREGLRQWFVARGSRPRSVDWFVSRQRNENWKFLPVEGEYLRNAETAVSPRIREAIESSRWILDLEDDWDELGSSKYSESTWQRACNFLVQQARFSRRVLGGELPSPRIQPGPAASIDMHWKMERFELLVNIPSDPSKSATFYGDDYGDLCMRGNLNPSEAIPGLVVWLLS